MIVNRLDLDIAVSEGIITRDQALRLRDLSARDLRPDDTPIDFTQDIRDEPFRLMRGFRDTFIALAVTIFTVGASAATVSVVWRLNPVVDDGDPARNGLWLAIVIAIALCGFGFGLAEIITRRHRLPLASMVVAIAFAAWWALLAAAVTMLSVYTGVQSAARSLNEFSGPLYWALQIGAVLGVSVFYWRYRLPFALLLVAGLLVILGLSMARDALGAAWLSDNGRTLYALAGFAVFAAAMWFDIRDRLRVTRLSECAFWLHLLAAPILVHTFLRASPDGAAGVTFILVALLILTVIAILIDRRALLVSGLSYFTIAVWQIASGNAVLADYRFALTTAVIGGFLLTLGLAWTAIRRVLVTAVPIPALKAILPPVAE